jgi:hypothetical protein
MDSLNNTTVLDQNTDEQDMIDNQIVREEQPIAEIKIPKASTAFLYRKEDETSEDLSNPDSRPVTPNRPETPEQPETPMWHRKPRLFEMSPCESESDDSDEDSPSSKPTFTICSWEWSKFTGRNMRH